MGKVTRKYNVKWTAAIAAAVVLVLLLFPVLAGAAVSITAPGSAVKDGDTCHTPFSANGNTNMIVELSYNGGADWEAPPIYEGLVSAAPVDGSGKLVWTVPVSFVTSTTCVLKITCDSGGPTESATSGDFTIDNTAPSFTSGPTANPASWTNANTIEISWTATDVPDAAGLTSEYRIDSDDDDDYTPNDSPLTLDVVALSLAEGKHTVDVRLTDAAGNQTTASVDIFVDRTPPNAFDAVPGTTFWTKNNVDVTFSTTDPLPGSGIDRYEVSLDGGGFAPHASPFTMTLEGVHTLDVKAVDVAGNERSANSQIAVSIDQTPPQLLDSFAWDFWNVAEIPVDYTAFDALSGIKTVTLWYKKGAGGTWTDSGLSSGADSNTFFFDGTTGDDTYYFGFVIEDYAGNVTSSNTGDGDCQTVLDTLAPEFTSISATPHYAKTGTTVTITFTASEDLMEDPVVIVNLNSATLVGSSGHDYTYSYTVLADDPQGPADIYIEGYDPAFNGGFVDDFSQLTIDTTPPEDFTPTANPASWTNAANVAITFSTTDAVTAIDYYEVAIDGGGFSIDVSPFNVDTSGLSDGTHVVHVKAVDLAGNELTKSVTIYIDKTAPADFTPTANPAGWTSANSVSILFSTTDATSGIAHYEVALDGGAYAAHASPHALDVSGIADGTHTVHVKAIDNAGNERIKDVTIYIDKAAPEDFTPTANPASWTSANSVSISFSTTDATSGIDHYEVALDGGAYAAHTSPYALDVSAVADGSHTVHVKAIDVAGLSTIRDVAIYLDKTIPADFTPAANPASWTSANSVQISFATTDATSGIDHYEVALDGGAYATHTSPYTLDVSAVADGTHTVHVKAIDAAGNERVKDVSIYLDKAIPADFTPAANPASWTSASSVSISFSTTDATSGIAHYEVALDGGAYSTHTSPYALNVSAVSDGTHTVHVKAIDNAGGERIKDVTIRLDKTAPADFTPTATPASWTSLNSVSISFSTTDATSGIDHYEVALDGGAYSTRTSSYAMDVSAVADGSHTVHVKAIDSAGNTRIKDVAIYLDKTAPLAFTPVSNPANWTGASTAQISFSTTDAASGIDHYQLAIDAGPYNTVASPATVSVLGLPEGDYTVHVKAIDLAGNVRIGDVVAHVFGDITPPAASLTFTDPSPGLGRQFDYVFWKNWMGVTTQAQNTYNINWTATDTESGLANVYIEFRKNSTDGWTLLESSTSGSGTVAFDVSSLLESDSYQFRIRAIDVAGNPSSVVYDSFGLYDATKLVPTAQMVTPPNGIYMPLGATFKIMVQETMPVFKDPRVTGRAYKDPAVILGGRVPTLGARDWWFSGHALTATPKMQAYKRTTQGRPKSLDKTLLASVPRLAPQSVVNTNSGQVAQFLGYVIVNTWETSYTLKKGVVSTADVFQVELKYSDIVSVGNRSQPDKSVGLPSVTLEPLINTLKQYEFTRFWVR